MDMLNSRLKFLNAKEDRHATLSQKNSSNSSRVNNETKNTSHNRDRCIQNIMHRINHGFYSNSGRNNTGRHGKWSRFNINQNYPDLMPFLLGENRKSYDHYFAVEATPGDSVGHIFQFQEDITTGINGRHDINKKRYECSKKDSLSWDHLVNSNNVRVLTPRKKSIKVQNQNRFFTRTPVLLGIPQKVSYPKSKYTRENNYALGCQSRLLTSASRISPVERTVRSYSYHSLDSDVLSEDEYSAIRKRVFSEEYRNSPLMKNAQQQQKEQLLQQRQRVSFRLGINSLGSEQADTDACRIQSFNGDIVDISIALKEQSLKKSSSETPVDVESVSPDIESVPQDIQNVSQCIESVSPDIESVPQDIESISQDIKSVPQDIENVPQDIESVSPDIESIPQDIESVSPDIECVSQDIESVSRDIDTVSQDAMDRDDDVATLQNIQKQVNWSDALVMEGLRLSPDNSAASGKEYSSILKPRSNQRGRESKSEKLNLKILLLDENH